jgi:hypothetical protein
LSVLYRPGQPIGAIGYCLLAVMLAPWLAVNVWGLVAGLRQDQELDVDCPSCGRSFTAGDLPELRKGRCPACGQDIASDLLQDL